MSYRMLLSGLIIRPACRSDIDSVASILGSVGRDPELVRSIQDRQGPLGQDAERLDRFLNWMTVAEIRDRIAGFLGWEQDETIGVIRTFAVNPEFQNLGIGTLLAADFIRSARSRGLRTLEAVLPSGDDRARRIFDRLHFDPLQCLHRMSHPLRPARTVHEEDRDLQEELEDLGYERSATWTLMERTLVKPEAQ